MVIPTEYDSHRLRLVSQSRKLWEPSAESVRTRACWPRGSFLGNWASNALGRPSRG